ncbi:hypothetical protein C8F04DRAFT_1401235 [Mycena alexandri]|uniref:Uncharacterized protein n=1 Tax=Mycena alexandri TaxID=1745969 RepID=A0AAD6WRD7_9AGAR|nr:hypothetical protein C8F04DRAFT_1401235 [Mycena alexandri]
MLSQPQPPPEPEARGCLDAPATATQFLAVATSVNVSNKRGSEESDEAPTGKKVRTQTAWCPQCHKSFATVRSRDRHVGITRCLALANRRGLPTKTAAEWAEQKSSFQSQSLAHLRESSEAFEAAQGSGRRTKPVAGPSGHSVLIADSFSFRAPSDATVMPPIPVVQRSTSVASVETDRLYREAVKRIMSEFRSTVKSTTYPMPPQAQPPLQSSESFEPSDLGRSYATSTASGSGMAPYNPHAGTQSPAAWYSMDIYGIEDHPAYIRYDPQLEQPPPELDVEEAWSIDAAYAQMPTQSEDWSQWDPNAFQIAETAMTAPSQVYYPSHIQSLYVPLPPYPSSSTSSHNYPEQMHPVSRQKHHPSNLPASGDGSRQFYPQPNIKTPPALRRSNKYKGVRSIPIPLAAEVCGFEAAPRPARYPREGVSTPAAIDHSWNVYGPADRGMRQIRTPRYPKRIEKEVKSEEQLEALHEGVIASPSSSGPAKGGVAAIPEVLEESTEVVEVTSAPVEAVENSHSSKTLEAMRVRHEEGKPAETSPTYSRGNSSPLEEQSPSLLSDEEYTFSAMGSGAYWTLELSDSSTPSTVDPHTPSDGLDLGFGICRDEASSEETAWYKQ